MFPFSENVCSQFRAVLFYQSIDTFGLLQVRSHKKIKSEGLILIFFLFFNDDPRHRLMDVACTK